MKKKLFIVVLALMIVRFVSAQPVFPFPTDQAQWTYYRVYPSIGANDWFYFYRNFLQGDSLFQGRQYAKIYQQTLCSCLCGGTSGMMPTNGNPTLLGGLREENGKVFFTRFGAGNGHSYFMPVGDTLLFDFTAQVGDSIPYSHGVILHVTQVSMNDDGRRQVHLSFSSAPNYPSSIVLQKVWVEGIGLETDGLLETTSGYYTNQAGCFSMESPFDCPIPCNASVNTGEHADRSTSIRVTPTSAADWVRIFAADPAESYTLQIFTLSGQMLDGKAGLCDGDVVRIDHLPAGVLIFRFQNTHHAVRTLRVIRQ